MRAPLRRVMKRQEPVADRGSHYFEEIPLPPDVALYAEEMGEVIDGQVQVRRILWDRAHIDADGTQHIPTGYVTFGPVDRFIQEHIGFYHGTRAASYAKTSKFVSGADEEGVKIPPARDEEVLAYVTDRGGRPRKDVSDAMLRDMRARGLSVGAMRAMLAQRGIELSVRTIARRLAEMEAACS